MPMLTCTIAPRPLRAKREVAGVNGVNGVNGVHQMLRTAGKANRHKFRALLLGMAMNFLSGHSKRDPDRHPDHAKGTRPPLLPWFAVAFAVLVAINSTGRLPAAAG
jgi:uncharacterized membrane protein YadS